MPFLTKTTPNDPKEIDLKQIAPNLFRVRRGFRYREPGGSTIYQVREGATTDLATVPWPLWWLVATYGRHTKAVLLHDSLVEDNMCRADRRDADRLLFEALKESGFGAPAERKTSWARRWMMWSAVALFGTMKPHTPFRLGLFLLHLLVFIGLLGYLAVVHLSPAVHWIAIPVGWAWDTAADFASWATGLWPFGWTPEVWQVAAIIGALGMLWALHPSVDTQLGLGLWPWAIIGVLVVAPPTILVLAAILIVAAFDLPSSIKWSIEHGEGLRGSAPIWTPTRVLSEPSPHLGDD